MIKERQINIVIADDHTLTRQGIASYLEHVTTTSFRIVGLADNGLEALTLCRRLRPDVLILDLHLPGSLDGLETLKQVKKHCPTTKVCIITGDIDIDPAFVVVYGANKCLLKNVSYDELIKVIVALAETAPEQRPEEIYNIQPDKLTKQELRILCLLALGHNNNKIAATLNITTGTVTNHLHNIYEKLGVRGKSEATSYAYKNGLVDQKIRPLQLAASGL